MKRYSLYFVYAVVLVALFPVLEFELYKYTEAHEEASFFSYWFRLIFSAPLLILFGIILVWIYTRIHKVAGFISIAIGIYWLVILFSDVIAEIRIF